LALIKKNNSISTEESDAVEFHVLDEAIDFFNEAKNDDDKYYAIEEIAEFDGGPNYLVELLKREDIPKEKASKIASTLAKLDVKRAPIEKIMELLKLHNAYVRNLGISLLRDYGDAIRYYIVKFLIGDDRDLRIFAINVLGDVDFAESREMMLELLETEQDINVAMTAVDYLAEIGQEDDIALLETIKKRFEGDAYVTFGVDNAIRSIRG